MILGKKTASEILTLAADTLTEEEWTKGTLFQVKVSPAGETKFCRCAHGQIQYCGLSEEQQRELRATAEIDSTFLKLNEKTGWLHGVSLNDYAPYLPDQYVYLGLDVKAGLRVYNHLNGSRYNENYHSFLAHYYAGRVG